MSKSNARCGRRDRDWRVLRWWSNALIESLSSTYKHMPAICVVIVITLVVVTSNNWSVCGKLSSGGHLRNLHDVLDDKVEFRTLLDSRLGGFGRGNRDGSGILAAHSFGRVGEILKVLLGGAQNLFAALLAFLI